MKLKHEYTNGEITVLWQPRLCIHCGDCARGLPQVFQPRERPWVKMEGASSDAIMKQVDACPSGAISYTKNEDAAATSPSNKPMEIDIKDNGPIMITGDFDLEYKGKHDHKTDGKIALCRCGASANKPYCDGSHSKIGFKDD